MIRIIYPRKLLNLYSIAWYFFEVRESMGTLHQQLLVLITTPRYVIIIGAEIILSNVHHTHNYSRRDTLQNFCHSICAGAADLVMPPYSPYIQYPLPDCNMRSIFTCWNKLFDTYPEDLPAHEYEPIRYGLTIPPEKYDPILPTGQAD
ncbi:hypothetical protein [Paraflavitalea speifideaquila]|uniref:hypothetical protein n=1 Tax=Paraflavitalea speifideaquila TaxID=3076558 RepID=UPI0028E94469|nr:hypothetical protein [Paraflavitalea speifideiaquila]